MQRVVLASNNTGKLAEFRTLLAPLAFDVIPQGELGVSEAEEPHVTFVENALAKARHAARVTGLPALADDSGVCVPSLGGAPGVISARYAGEPRSDARNNQKLLTTLEGATERRAFYTCVLVWLDYADDPHPLIAEADWWGEITTHPRGSRGFGYDPVFWLPTRGCTAAELDPAVKNELSHRGQAMRLLAARLHRHT